MTSLAEIAGIQSNGVFALLSIDVGEGTAVAANATDRQRRVINLCAQPRRHRMATLTAQRRRDMRCETFASGQGAVVAINTCAQPLGMVELHFVFPQARECFVARLANVRRGQADIVLAAFSAGINLVMARHAVVDQQSVINRCGYPRVGGMTNIAILNCRNMGGF